ncbi:MAG TPA: histidine phosphatase family protein [Ktedonobacteraceae bacterium]|nr:histidine phosphatase family protein [Ktedonobacteraceae bacterium]
MSRTRLVLVRHGETLANREYRYIGARDDALSERGLAQAESLADALAFLPVNAVYCSPLQRAYRTALPIAARHQAQVQVQDELIEGRFGRWEGMTRAEVLALGTEEEQRLRAWERDPSIAPPDGESFAAVRLRVYTLVERLAQIHADQTIVLVSHVGPIKVLLCEALNAPLSSMFRIFLDPATISVVDWREPYPIVRLLNSHAHLGWEEARWMQM